MFEPPLQTSFAFRTHILPSICRASQEDRVLQVMNLCAFAMAKAMELMDHAGLILSALEATATSLSLGIQYGSN